MDDPEVILKELRVDWEGTCSKDFNPLHLGLKLTRNSALYSSFRDMFYRLESAMEKIIATNFRGFSSSIEGYSAYRKTNTELLQVLQSIVDTTDLHKSTNLGVQSRIVNLQSTTQVVELEYRRKHANELKYTICKDITTVKQLIYEFDISNDIYRRSNLVTRALNALDRPDYLNIRGVDEYRKMVQSKYTELIKKVNSHIAEYVFLNKKEQLHVFKCVIILESLGELEKFFKETFRARLCEQIEETILRVYRSEDPSLEHLCSEIVDKIESITKNMQQLIKYSNENFERNEKQNFFGSKSSSSRFCFDPEFVLKIIRSELEVFVQRYSQYSEESCEEFDMNCVVDDLDYTEIYAKFPRMTSKLAETSHERRPTTGKYTLIAAPRLDVALCLLKSAKSPSLRAFLSDKIGKKYAERRLEGITERINLIFASDILSIDLSSLRLNLYNKIIKLFDEYDTPEYRSEAKSQVNEKINAAFKQIYCETFRDKFILDLPGSNIADDAKAFCEFKSWISTSAIAKSDLILSLEKTQLMIAIINTLREFYGFLVTDELHDLYHYFLNGFRFQLFLEFLYFFDLFFREGSYKLYIRKMIKIPQYLNSILINNQNIINNEYNSGHKYFEGLYSIIEEYVVQNMSSIGIRDRDGLERLFANLRVLDEMLVDVEPSGSFKGIYRMFDRALAGKAVEKAETILQHKISQQN